MTDPGPSEGRPADPGSPRRMSRPSRAAELNPPRTLAEVPEALAGIRPARQAPLEQWLVYYQRSAALYAEIAEIDRGHHHEALYMAEHERERAKEIKAQIATQQSSDREQREGVDCGQDRAVGSTEDVDAGA